MAPVKYTRIGKPASSSSSYLSTVTIIVIVALCLVGVWMMTSSSVVPIQNTDVSLGTNIDDVSAKAHLTDRSNENTNASVNKDEENSVPVLSGSNEITNTSSEVKSSTSESGPIDNEGKTTPFEDKDVPKGDATNPPEQNPAPVEKEKSVGENQEEKPAEKNQEEKPVEKNQEEQPAEKNQEEQPAEKSQEEKPVEEKKKDGGDNENKPGNNDSEKKPEESPAQAKNEEKGNGEIEKKVEEKNDKGLSNQEKKNEVYPSGVNSGLLNETTAQSGSFSTQAAESKNEKEAQKSSGQQSQKAYNWKLCKTNAGPDFIPCLDNVEAVAHLRSTMHFEHRERHCPANPPTCLVPLPEGYQRPIGWPTSRDKIWYHNVPHTQLAEYKKDQNWVKVSGEYLNFPGGGTQFKNGALHYIDNIQHVVPEIAWGKRSRVILDVGCGVASFGGYLFERDALTMSLAPKDEHEAQVQFALERGIPAVHNVMGTKRLPFPGKVFDAIHCARCRVPWHADGGRLLLELNRLLRPGGFFVWSATPVYERNSEDTPIWEAMTRLTGAMCWELVTITKDKRNGVGIAFYRKPANNECYDRRDQKEPPFCPENDDPNAAWNVSLQACLHKIPASNNERGSHWPEQWPARLEKPPYWLSNSQVGVVYGKPAPEDFTAEYEHWKHALNQSYLNGIGINWSTVRNVMDMRAIYGGFAAALKDMNLWVMNVVSVDDPDTLPIVYERGLIGTYHDWCESFNTYPRSYDLLHANHLFSTIKKRCNYKAFIAEVDRILRPEGKLIVRDNGETITELENMLKSMHWEIRMTFSADKEGLLCAEKTIWRPSEVEPVPYAIRRAL